MQAWLNIPHVEATPLVPFCPQARPSRMTGAIFELVVGRDETIAEL